MPEQESQRTSIFQRTTAEIIHDLNSITKCPEDLNRCFICKHDLEKLWQDKERIRRLLPDSTKAAVIALVQREMFVILSVLVLIGAIWQDSDILKKLLKDDDTPRYKDDDIPLSLDRIAEFLDPPHDGLFHEKQFRFCPFIVDCHQTQQVHDVPQNWRLPFDKEEELGLGSFGQVDLVKIAPRCFKEVGGAEYPEYHLVACKKFHVPRKSRSELKNLQILKESLTRQDRIMQHLATLRHGDDFYILFPYAEHRDLSLFLHAGFSANKEKIYDFEEEFPGLDLVSADPAEVSKLLLRQCWALSNAIKWLHSGIAIESTANEVYCAHMDLKPENILIRHDRNSKVGKWMISDFGISMTPEQEQKNTNFLTVGDWYDHLTDRSRLTGSSRPGRAEGSYQAPEATSKRGDEVAREGDIWSFGCIFTEVLAWAIGRDAAVNDLVGLRSREGGNDCFFDNDHRGSGRKPATFCVKGSVNRWLDDKIETGAQQNIVVPCWARAITLIMIVDPKQRPDASTLEFLIKNVKDHSENPQNHSDNDCPEPRNPSSLRSSSSPSLQASTPSTPSLQTPPASPPSLSPTESTRDPISAPVGHSERHELIGGKGIAVAVSQAEKNGKTLAAYLSKKDLHIFELDVRTFECKPKHDYPISLRSRELKLENTGVAINGSHIAFWGYSAPQGRKLMFLRTLTDAQLHLSDPEYDNNLLSVAVSTDGVFALVHAHDIVLRQRGANPIKLTLPQGIIQAFTHATFNDNGTLLFAWAWGRTSESVYAWWTNPEDSSSEPHFANHYLKQRSGGKPPQISIIPYNSENKCIIANLDDRKWTATAVSVSENPSVAPAHLLGSERLRNLVSGCVFQDRYFVGLWSNMLQRDEIVRFQIVDDSTSGLRLDNREFLFDVSTSCSSSSRIRVFRPDLNDGATVIICHESGKIEFVKVSVPA
ncbi:hypothetical protein Aspvir_002316 [Aspergillus viridinutans]|uniref:non-specific serine/threonine protein kinase n=1 Tax=Aspergillus viridinutans TaxID=75553 RepID=A0A9P3C7R5_ASPVI|nr:uncharacterized protein Aspvir_002316 [Aspergillus viridinutans]GIK06666.1 hypothetical protein Aspvir_002316 [Aspergillus viridinutans]